MRKTVSWEGRRTEHGTVVERVDELGERSTFPQRVVYHSPTGFEWGYGGSGPSDLALNILADVAGFEGTWRYDRDRQEDLEPEWVWGLHNAMKFDLIASQPQHQLLLSRIEVERWLEQKGVVLNS